MAGFEDFDASSYPSTPDDGLPPGWGGAYVPPPPAHGTPPLLLAPTEEPENSVMERVAPWAGQAVVPNWQQPVSPVQVPYDGGGYPVPAEQLGEPDLPVIPTSHMLGLATVLVAAGAAVGLHYGGPFGGLAGSLLGGAVANGYRAVSYYRQGTPDADKEAKISAAYAVIAAAGGGYLSYKFAGDKRRRPNPPDDDDPPRERCRPRPVGL